MKKLAPDLLVLQEVVRANDNQTSLWSDPLLWHGVAAGLGIAIVAAEGWRVEPLESSGCGFALTVTGTVSFPLLGIWSHPMPTYGRAVIDTCDVRREVLGYDQAVVTGDFNSHAASNNPRNRKDHKILVEKLESELGLVSAYHAFLGVGQGEEPHATHFFRYQETSPFHIDYCFVPKSWSIERVEVGSYAEWGKLSDHVPLIVDVTPRRGAEAGGQRHR